MEEKDILVSTIQALNATNVSLSKTIDSQSKTIESLELRIKELSAQVAYLNRQLFGRKSEKLQALNPLQLKHCTQCNASQASSISGYSEATRFVM